MPPTDFPQPTFWLLYGDYVWFLGYCLGCISVAVLVVWKSCFPKSRLGWGFVSIAALCAAIVVPLVLPHPTEPYAQGYPLPAYSLVLIYLVCGIKPLIEYRDGDPNSIAKFRFGAVLLQIMVLGLVIGAFQESSPSAPTNVPHCKNNLKQIGLALYNRADDVSQSGKPPVKEGMPPMSWRVALLPYIDRATLRKQYRDDLPWDDPANLEIARTTESSLVCPSTPVLEDSQKRKFTSYALVTGLGTECPDGRSLDSIRLDGKSQTAIVIEACGRNIVWTEPRDVDVSVETLSLNQRGPRPLESPSLGSSLHRRGVNVLRADGSVRTMPLNTDPKVLKALMVSDEAGKGK